MMTPAADRPNFLATCKRHVRRKEETRQNPLTAVLFCFQLILPVIKVLHFLDVQILIIRLVVYAEGVFITKQFQFSNIELEHVCQTVQYY